MLKPYSSSSLISSSYESVFYAQVAGAFLRVDDLDGAKLIKVDRQLPLVCISCAGCGRARGS